jgi:hypothetical protein
LKATSGASSVPGDPVAQRAGGQLWRRLAAVRRRFGKPAPSPQTTAWLGFHELHDDRWAGPLLEQDVEIVPGAGRQELLLEGETLADALPQPLSLQASLGAWVRTQIDVGSSHVFSHRLALDAVPPGRHRLVLRANGYVVPHDRWGNGDYRPLSYRLTTCALAPAEASVAHHVESGPGGGIQ